MNRVSSVVDVNVCVVAEWTDSSQSAPCNRAIIRFLVLTQYKCVTDRQTDTTLVPTSRMYIANVRQ